MASGCQNENEQNWVITGVNTVLAWGLLFC